MEISDLLPAFFVELWTLTKEMAPYLLLGFLFAGILHVYFPTSRIRKYLGRKNRISALNAAILGIPLPLCSCGVIPTGISFYKNGASRGSTVSFLISTPQTGIDSIMVTYSLLGLPFAVIRPVIALITGVAGGLLTDFRHRKEKEEKTIVETTEETVRSNLSSRERLGKMFHYAFVEFLNDISKWLIIGLLAAALIAVLVPDSFFTDYVGNEFLSMLIILVASVPMYVCATGSVPIAAVLIAKGISPGAAIVFLMAGPATNVATMMVIGNAMGRKTLAMYLLSIIGGALVFGTLVNEWPAVRSLFSGMEEAGHLHSHFPPDWVNSISAWLLGALIIHGYLQQNKKTTPANMNSTEEAKVKIAVNGMTCGHCKSSVETAIGRLEGIEEATADLQSREVAIKGKNIDLEKVRTTIQQLGYEYDGER